MNTIALGHCYDWALMYLRDHGNAIMVHGTVAEPFHEPESRFEHAWIVETDIVKDWQSMKGGGGGNWQGIGYPLDVFEKLFKPRPIAEFTDEEAMILAIRSGHQGPWPSGLIKEVKANVKKLAARRQVSQFARRTKPTSHKHRAKGNRS